MSSSSRSAAATIWCTRKRLRVDRQLEEALAHGPDPLHLAAVFGLDPKTAIRYAENARLLLTTRAEEQDPASSREPKGRTSHSMKTLRFIVKTLQFA